MRYTTIIDIRDVAELYRATSVRLVYLHLVLAAGYHDHDRDQVRISLRRLAADTGLTLAAVRCAVVKLAKWHMLVRNGDVWTVRKWVREQPITTRAKTAKEQTERQRQAAIAAERRRRAAELEEESAERERDRADGRTSRQKYIDHMITKAAAGDEQAAIWCEQHADEVTKRKNETNDS